MEAIVDASGVAARVEARLPVGVRPRQLSVRTLLVGMLLAAAADRPAHLTRVLAALRALPEGDRRRLGVDAAWPAGAHPLTYRQLEYTLKRIVRALAKDEPDGTPSDALSDVLDRLLEASVQHASAPASSSLAVDWTDHESFSRPPPEPDAACADPEASWGRRRRHGPGDKDELFYGYYLQVATIVKDDDHPDADHPDAGELVRRITLTSCHVDPPSALVPVLERLTNSGIKLTDVLADSGYAYRMPEHWALPVRRLGAQLVVDLHPNDRGPHGTHMGAIRCNGNLYCPATPRPLLELAPLARGATPDQTATHDNQTAELARYKLSKLTSYDADGYHRVACPATQGKLRCPLRRDSMTLPHTHPEILTPPTEPPACCRQQTLTVPPTVNAKTAQKHDYPSAAHRRSYARRSAAERAYATTKDPATTNLTHGWCRLMGLTPNALFATTAYVIRNLRITDAHAARHADNARRHANGLPPKTRRRRRRDTIDDLITTAHRPP
ncbi:MAG: hypothetical protein WAL38_36200 [Solirubrobacteraceae bacterium]